MISLRGLTKRYGAKTVVDDLALDVLPGRVTGFLGPNGAGKSTTMRMVLGLDHPTSGSALVGGRPYAALRHPLRELGALLDARAVHPGLTARTHLTALARSNGIPVSRVAEVLETVGLTEVADRRTGSFSLGMGQRLGIAAALLGDPAVLLFDEPVNGLDPDGVRWVRRLMRSLAAEGRTVFVSSHLMSEMALTADHLVVIGRGRLLADTGMREFIDRNSRSSVRLRTPEPEKLRDVLAAAGITATEDGTGTFEVADDTPAERLGELALEHRIPLHELSPQQASLEEAFIALTGEAAEYRTGPLTAKPVPSGYPAAPETTRTETTRTES